MRIVLLLLAALCLIGCAGRPKPVATMVTTTTTQQTDTKRESVTDSTTVRDELKFTPVAIVEDSAGADLQLETTPTGQLKPVSYETRGKRASAAVTVTPAGQLSVRCKCDAWRDSVATLSRTVTQLRREAGQHVRTEYRNRWRDRWRDRRVEVPRPVAWWDWGARILGGAAGLLGLILLILWLAYRRRNPQPHTNA